MELKMKIHTQLNKTCIYLVCPKIIISLLCFTILEISIICCIVLFFRHTVYRWRRVDKKAIRSWTGLTLDWWLYSFFVFWFLFLCVCVCFDIVENDDWTIMPRIASIIHVTLIFTWHLINLMKFHSNFTALQLRYRYIDHIPTLTHAAPQVHVTALQYLVQRHERHGLQLTTVQVE